MTYPGYVCTVQAPANDTQIVRELCPNPRVHCCWCNADVPNGRRYRYRLSLHGVSRLRSLRTIGHRHRCLQLSRFADRHLHQRLRCVLTASMLSIRARFAAMNSECVSADDAVQHRGLVGDESAAGHDHGRALHQLPVRHYRQPALPRPLQCPGLYRHPARLPPACRSANVLSITFPDLPLIATQARVWRS